MKNNGRKPSIGALSEGSELAAPASLPTQLPARLEPLSDSTELMTIWAQQVTARSTEAQVLTGLLDYRAQAATEVAGEHLFYRQATDKAAVHDAAQMLGVADQTAAAILNAAGFIREDLPNTWETFSNGLICLPRLRKIAVAAILLPADQPELLATLDAEVSIIAPEKTTTELGHWLTRRIPELDTDAYQEQAEEALAHRYVRIEHRSDGTSYLEALLPTVEAVVIEKRLKKVAASMDTPQPADPPADTTDYQNPHHDQHPQDSQTPTLPGITEPTSTSPEDHCPNDQGPDESDPAMLGHHEDHPHNTAHPHLDQADPNAVTGAPVDGRTRAQREADLLSAWLRTGTSYGTPVDAKICVLIPETTLKGEAETPGISADRSWVLPADQARKLATDPLAEHQWYTATTRPNPAQAGHDILTITYHGRFAPQRLKDAIIFRDGVCQAQGCTVPAERCDIDHQKPYETGGPTTGTNTWALCRRHHHMKSHGYLPVPAT